jgi:NADH-quinone oxidoreductase subunit C
LPSADAATEVAEAPGDERRLALVEALTAELGQALAGYHLDPGRDLWVRVAAPAWAGVAAYLRDRQRFQFFNWLSAIDWLPSPYGRGLDAEVDKELGRPTGAADTDDDAGPREVAAGSAYATGVAGGDTRFQVVARVGNLATGIGVTLKADLADDDPRVGTWTRVYPGADWHEREAWEMFGIVFEGHPWLRKLYLPADFEGHPLRKDFPLLSRLIKPWPGIVDVEPMPEAAPPQADAAPPAPPEGAP